MINEAVTFIPEPGEPVPTTAPTPPAPDADGWLDHITDWLDATPGWMWLAFVALLFVSLMVTRHRLDKSLRTNPSKAGDKTGKLGGLFTLSVLLATALWGCILAASGTNLLAFSRETLNWRNGHEWLTVGGVDGIAVVFAVLMFAAAKAGRPTHRAYRIVWSSTLMSAGIGVWQGYGSAHSLAAAVLLGYFALASMGVLHELLDLFRSTTEKKSPRIRPPFGLRWMTYFPNTVCAALAWENHPPRPLPADATDDQIVWYGSVRHAVAHLETVRRAKRVAQYAIDVPAGGVNPSGWARVLPWLRLRQVQAALVDLRESAVGEAVAAASQIADLTRRLTETTTLFEDASDEAQRSSDDAQLARRQAADATAAADAVRLDAAARVAAAEQKVSVLTERVDHLDRQLNTAREDVGVARQQAAKLSLDAQRAVSELSTARAAAEQIEAAHRAEVEAVAARLTQQRDEAVNSARLLREQAAHRRIERAPREQESTRAHRATAERPNTDRSPSSPPWSPKQLRAFELRDADPKAWTWGRLAEEVGAGSSSVRRWFTDRTKHEAAQPTALTVPTTPIPDPRKPVTVGTNGTRIKP